MKWLKCSISAALIKTTFPRLGHTDNHKEALRYRKTLCRGAPSHMLMSGWWLPEPTLLEHLLECVGWLPGWIVMKHLS